LDEGPCVRFCSALHLFDNAGRKLGCEAMRSVRSIAALIIVSSFLISGAFSQDTPVSNQPQQEFDYQRWVRAYREGRLNPRSHIKIYGDDAPKPPEPLAVITIIESEDWRRVEPYASLGGLPRVASQQCRIESAEQVGPRNTPTRAASLSREKSERAALILSRLPDDHERLPPPGRRLAVAVTSSGLVRVYDRANLPDDVMELVRVAGCEAAPWIMHFPLSRWWTLEQFAESGIRLPIEPISPTFSPDGAVEVLQGLFNLLVVDVKTSNRIAEIHSPVIAGRMYEFLNPRFTPDGHHLLVLTGEPRIHVYDTATWNEVELPQLPPGATQFFPSSDWSRGVAVSAAGEVGLWTSGSSSENARLEDDAELLDASFSPDDSLVATLTQTKSKAGANRRHFRIWDAGTGKLMGDLLPSDVQGGGMMWWSQGKYLLARVATSISIGIWNAQSGRYRGEFSGCLIGVDRFTVLPDDEQLFARCNGDEIVKWDLASAIDRIEELERSFPIQ
jgi:hypothetical protein